MNDIDKRLPLYHRVRDDMLSKIASGAWPRDAAIPTEVELTQSYGVAIGTVRKAVDTLVADGLLERSQGRGTFIRRPDFQSSLFRFFRHRGGGGRETAPKGRILGRVLGPPPAPVAQALQLPAGDQAIRLDRVRLVDEQPVLLEEIWLPHQRFAALMEMAESDFGDLLYPLYEQRCGQTVASAQETLTVEAAGADVAERLGMAPGAPVVVIDRLALGYDRQPLEWRRSRGPADGFRYQVEIR